MARAIADLLEGQTCVGVAEIVRATQANRNTVKATLANLRRQELLAQHGKGRGGLRQTLILSGSESLGRESIASFRDLAASMDANLIPAE